MKTLTIYGRDGYGPCVSLKKLLERGALTFKFVDVTTLGRPEADALRRSMCTVSGIRGATVPAAEVSDGTASVWIFNHSHTDVSTMFDKIRAALA
jgi:hypothetical protein